VSVREVFEVMAQVDHDLTTVNCFDQQLGLIKNLGRHISLSSPISFWVHKINGRSN
jgi:hypothetical protein